MKYDSVMVRVASTALARSNVYQYKWYVLCSSAKCECVCLVFCMYAVHGMDERKYVKCEDKKKVGRERVNEIEKRKISQNVLIACTHTDSLHLLPIWYES